MSFRSVIKVRLKLLPVVFTKQSVARLSNANFWKSQPSSKSRRVVVVLGWAGSKQAHVEKYSELYNNTFGLNAYGCILPMSDFMSYDHRAQARFSENFLNFVVENNQSDVRLELIIHSLSNNGFTVYQHIAQKCLHDHDFSKKFAISGVILDSAPGPLSWPSFMACRVNLGSNVAVQRLLTPTVDNSKRLFRPVCTILYNFYIDRMDRTRTTDECLREAMQVAKRFGTNWYQFSAKWAWPGDYMLQEKAPWPLLFLYSDADNMMPAAFVERVIEAQRSMAFRSVFSHNFVTSGHVAHLKAKPDAYKNEIKKFLNFISAQPLL